ncbi:MAG: hypothetical protein ACKOI0_02325, partial [Actinomycetota bacterium]
MRLVTFDRGGRRRLGAILQDRIVDLPGLVGHPAFPTSLESLVQRNGGSLMPAAVAALERGEVDGFVVDAARLLPPVLPASLRSPDTTDGERPLLGADALVPWEPGTGWLEVRPKLVVVLGRPLDHAAPEEVPAAVFGYALLADWRAVAADGDPTPLDRTPLSLGPWVETTFAPSTPARRGGGDGPPGGVRDQRGVRGRGGGWPGAAAGR